MFGSCKAGIAAAVLTTLPSLSIAQQPENDDDSDTGETIVTATREPRLQFDTPVSTDIVDSDRIRERGYRTTPQALRDLPGVMVQETAHGQGSPFIRGFTGFRNQLLIDGIRLNNSVFREGPNQYWNTVDPLSVRRFELVRGPSSVLYGSDAIGGTLNAITKTPNTYGPGRNFGGNVYYRYATAEDSHIGRVEGSATNGTDFGVHMGLSAKSFGDISGGRDTGTQPNTGYDEWDADLKLEKFVDDKTRFVVAYQHVKQNNVPRTHRTIFAVPFAGTTVGSDLRHDLNQERQLAYAQLHGDDLDGPFDRYSLSLSWQEQSESRDRIRGSMAQDGQGLDVGTLGLFANFSTDTTIGRLTYGGDFYHDEVDSFSTTNPIQGPVGDEATYDLLGLFVQDEIEVNEELDVTLGARFNYAAADADSVSDPVTSNQIAVEDNWSSVVGSARFVYHLRPDTVNVFGGISQGFRAPNLSDLTRFNTARSNEFEIPSPNLDAEKYINYELGVKTREADTTTQVAVFYTDIQDQITRFPTGNVNGDGDAEITKDNIGDGYVYGIEVGAAHNLNRQWSMFGNLTFQDGETSTFPTSAPILVDEPISRLMPFTSQLGVRWDSEEGDLWAELVGIYAADADDLNTRDMGDTGRIPPGGTPSYLVFHARGGVRVNEHVSIDLAVENLTNEDYRIHGSGQNMPGLNFVLGLTFSR